MAYSLTWASDGTAAMRNKTPYRKPPFILDRSRYGDLAAQIATGLRTAIETGYYKAGDVLPPVRDLGEILGVSMGIAVQAVTQIREEGLISPRPRIGSVVCEKNRPLWKGHVVTVVPSQFGNPFENAIYIAVRNRLTAAGYLVTPASVRETRRGHWDDFSLLDTVLRQQTDLVVQLQTRDNITRWLSKRGVPFVSQVKDGNPSLPNCVGTFRRDDNPALSDLVAHCREAGVKSVLQVADYLRADLTEALGREGVKVSTLRVPSALHDGTGYALGCWAAEVICKRFAKGRGWLPDLLFFQDDYLATGALLALGMAGVRIPDDVHVVTWANKDFGPIFPKPLTRMEMDNAAIGETIANGVLECLKGGKFPEGVVVGPRYIRGETF